MAFFIMFAWLLFFGTGVKLVTCNVLSSHPTILHGWLLNTGWNVYPFISTALTKYCFFRIVDFARTKNSSVSPLGGPGESLAPCGLILWDVLLVSIWPQVQKSAPVPTQQKRMVAQYIHLVRIVGMFIQCLFWQQRQL